MSEAVAGLFGFVALVVQARRLGPEGFARFEWAAAVTAWLLVVVRGGMDVIVLREAARHPRLIGPLTDLLIGLRLAAAGLSYAIILAIAACDGSGRGPALALAGLVLLVSAGTADVGLRATGRLGPVALAQGVRAAGYLGFVAGLVRAPGDVTLAALGLVVAESVSVLMTLIPHAKTWGMPRARYRRRVGSLLVRRGAVAGLTRFGRVTLYGADLLVLGAWSGTDPEMGTYAASRRVVFAVVALGVVLPAALGPAIARAWAFGHDTAQRLVADAADALLTLAIPAAVGLGLTAGRWMPLLFGPGYHDGGPWLALNASRLPCLLMATFLQATLIACRREGEALRNVAGTVVLGIFLIPSGLIAGGPWGVAWGVLAVEAAGAADAWRRLRRLGLTPGRVGTWARIGIGCLMMTAVCLATRHLPVGVSCLAGATAYGAAWVGRPFGRIPA